MLIDTNVLAYLLITGDRTREARALYLQDADWRSESFALIEFSNILVTYLRTGALSRTQAHGLLVEAEKRVRLVTVSHERALRVAERFGVSAYDARFLAAEHVMGTKLVTEDAHLRAAAPEITSSIADALAG